MAFDAGSAISHLSMDISGLRQAAAEAKAIYASIAQAGAAAGKFGVGGGGAPALQQQAAAAQRAADATLRLAQAQAQLARASGDDAKALGILQSALHNTTGASERATLSVQTSIARLESGKTLAGEFGTAISGSLTSILGPAALVAGALGLAKKAVDEFGEAFKFGAELQESRAAFGGILGDFQKGNAVLDEATKRGRIYGFTQGEVTKAFKALAPIIRESTSSTQDQVEALARISVLRPDDPVNALSRAVEGIRKGRFAEIAGEMGLTKAEAQALSKEVAEGKDAFLALNEALDKHGITLKVAEERMQGAAGALRDLALAQAEVKKAESDLATSQGGIAIVKGQSAVYKELAGLLNGNSDALDKYGLALQVATGDGVAFTKLAERSTEEQQANAQTTAIATAALAAETAVKKAAIVATTQATQVQADERRESILASQALQDQNLKLRTAAPQAELLAAKTQLLARQEQIAAQAFITANPHISASGIRAAIVAGVIPKLTGELAILTLQLNETKAALAGLGSGTPEQGGDAINRFTTFKDKAKAFQDVQADAAKKAREQQVLSTGTERQKLSILQQQEATARKIFGAGSAQAIEAHTAVIREQQSIASAAAHTAVGHTSELGKQLNLQENIRDALNAQYHAQLDAAALAIKDRQDRRKEDRELAAAQRILASPTASSEFKAAAADKIALINVERQQRAADIADKSLTAGGSIINGKVFQGKPGGAGGVPTSAGGTVAPTAAPGGAGGATGGGGGGLTIQFVVNGHVISQEIIPDVIAALHNGLRQTNNAGGGRAP